MTIHLAAWQVAAIAALVAIEALLALKNRKRSRSLQRRLDGIRRMAEDNSAHVPDDLLHGPRHATFERASRYWSTMVLRELDREDPQR